MAETELSNAERALKRAIDEVDIELRELQKLRGNLTAVCERRGHVIVPRNPKYEHTSAVCYVCQTDFGWYCPKSPDKYCHYEDSEFCIYCGNPSERK